MSLSIGLCTAGADTSDFDSRFFLSLGGIAAGVLGGAAAIATLTIGTIFLSTSKKSLGRLYPLLPSNSRFRDKAEIGFRIGPQFVALDVGFF